MEGRKLVGKDSAKVEEYFSFGDAADDRRRRGAKLVLDFLGEQKKRRLDGRLNFLVSLPDP